MLLPDNGTVIWPNIINNGAYLFINTHITSQVLEFYIIKIYHSTLDVVKIFSSRADTTPTQFTLNRNNNTLTAVSHGVCRGALYRLGASTCG